jgi:macrolide transport system ATP-binding/permease protein
MNLTGKHATTRFWRPWRWLVALIGVIVPRRMRADWRQEWEAELRHRETLLAAWDKLGWRTKLDLLRRSLGAFRDALLLQPRRLEDEMIQDLRFGVRMLLKHKGFSAVAVLTLALGIGANTAIFSLIHTVLLRPLSVAQPERLARIYTRGSQNTSFPNYRDLAAGNQVFAELAGHAIAPLNLGQGETLNRVHGELVTGNYFAALGVRPAIGRTFGTETDGAVGAHPVAVVSHGLWQRRFNGDRALVGRTIALNGRQFTVIGIMPQGFRGTWPLVIAPEVWTPVTMQPVLFPGPNRLEDRGAGWFDLFGRLKPGVSLAQAQSAVIAQTTRLAETWPEQNRGLEQAEVLPLDAVRGASFLQAVKVFAGLLSALVGLVLLIACANVANLLLARAALRRQEIAVRLALGATRWRLLRQLLTESMLLALAGGAAGCLLAVWLMGLVRAWRPPAQAPVPIEINPTLDVRMLLFTLLVLVIAGVIFGLAPAWQSSRLALAPWLKEGRGTMGGRAARFSLRNILVVTQVAVSLLLLICAGLFLRSLGRAQRIDPGFETERVLTVALDLRPGGYDATRGNLFYQQMLDQVERLPGVQSASLGEIIPLTFSRNTSGVEIEGQAITNGEVDNNRVAPRYFETMGIRLLAGRGFTRHDTETTPPVVIVNQTMAQRFWPGQSPLGKRLRIPLDNRGNFTPYYEVVGLVKDSKYVTLGEEPKPFYYKAALQDYQRQMVLHVMTSGDPNALRKALRESLSALDQSLLIEVATMQENLALALLPARIAASLLGLLGLLGLGLALVGIYGVISYALSQRTNEIGLRVALGARPLDVLRLVLGQGMKLTLLGIALGAAAAFGLTRFLASLLVGVSPTDPLTFATLAGLFCLVSLLACYLPAPAR